MEHTAREQRPPRRRDDDDDAAAAAAAAYLSPIAGYDEPRKSHFRPHTPSDLNATDARRSERQHSHHRRPRLSPRSPRSPRLSPVSWPPSPSVENETISLKKELGGDGLLRRTAGDDVPSRGTIDQDPIIVDVQEPTPRRPPPAADALLGDPRANGVPTPPTSEDERAKRERRRPSRITTDFDHVAPELQKRVASPYAISRPASSKPAPFASDAFLSPNVLTPPPADPRARRTARVASTPQPSSTPRLSPTFSKGRDYFTPNGNADDVVDDRDTAARPSLPARATSARPDARIRPAQRSPRTSAVDFAPTPKHPPFAAPLAAPALAREETRRQTDTASSVPKPRGLDKPNRVPSPLVVASALNEVNRSLLASSDRHSSTLTPPEHRRPGSSASCNASPISTRSRASDSPPLARSPRHSADLSFDRHSSGSALASAVSSASASRPSTPPSAVAMPAMPQTDHDWSDLLAANAARRAKNPAAARPPSRLLAMRADSMPTVPGLTPAVPGRSSLQSSLPYPVDHGPATPTVNMPLERDHQWFPPAKPANLDTPERGGSRSSRNPSQTTPAPPPPPPPPRPSVRPPVSARSSATDVSPTEARPPPPIRPSAGRSATLPNNPPALGPTRQEVDAMVARGLKGCPRELPVANRDDWYTLVGAPALDFCPDCIDNVFERTFYRKFFRRSLPRDLGTRVQCAFATPWVRLAYLITLHRRQPDLHLLKGVSDLESAGDPCPGRRAAVRSWYGVRDDDGYFVSDFRVCRLDVCKLERLLPALAGFFQPLPDRGDDAVRQGPCSLRADATRFHVYVNAIIDLNDKANANAPRRPQPDRMPFVALVERKLALRECERDNMVLDGLWHYIPAIPSFTVCEECYDEVVEPEIRRGSDLADRFNRAVQPAYRADPAGTSCQLYSQRMRKVFRDAVGDGDARYLSRKANERREVESRLQARFGDAMRRLDRLDARAGGGSGSEDDERRRLGRELEKITAEWKQKWE